MRYNRISRRFFLQGMGASLMMPFLPSLLPRAYAAGAPPLRYVQVISAFGLNYHPGAFFNGDTSGFSTVATNVLAKPMSAISGDFSTVLGSAMTPFKSKISVIRGLNGLMSSEGFHSSAYPTCASGSSGDHGTNAEGPGLYFPYSVDSVLSESSKVYPTVGAGVQRHVNFAPNFNELRYTNFSWNRKNGVNQYMPSTYVTNGLLGKFSQFTPSSSGNTTDVRRRDVIQAVYGDYKSVRDSGKLSTSDRQRLEGYMSIVDQIQKDLAATPVQTACTNPSVENSTDNEAIHRSQINILVAAMACDLTRVASYVIGDTYDIAHDTKLGVHNWENWASVYPQRQKLQLNRYAYLLKQMDSVIESTGTLLDNSVVYWGNEFGEFVPTSLFHWGDGGGEVHRTENMGAVVAGGAGGRIQTGYFIDYRKNATNYKTGAYPFNNLMITFLNAMGLSSSDYQRDGVVGFGEYNQNVVTRYGFQNLVTNAERIKPLPFLYKGPTMG